MCKKVEIPSLTPLAAATHTAEVEFGGFANTFHILKMLPPCVPVYPTVITVLVCRHSATGRERSIAVGQTSQVALQTGGK